MTHAASAAMHVSKSFSPGSTDLETCRTSPQQHGGMQLSSLGAHVVVVGVTCRTLRPQQCMYLSTSSLWRGQGTRALGHMNDPARLSTILICR